jgi:hypothetical protein
MTSNIQELEPRVANLEATLAKLIENLADNNAKFIDALVEIAGSDERKKRVDAAKKCEAGICPNDPPRCKKKDKDKDHD